MIRRPPRSTLSSSSAASDVYKRQLPGVLRPTTASCRGVSPPLVLRRKAFSTRAVEGVCQVRRRTLGRDHLLACKSHQQRLARRNQFAHPGRQSTSPRVPEQAEDDRHYLPHCWQAPDSVTLRDPHDVAKNQKMSDPTGRIRPTQTAEPTTDKADSRNTTKRCSMKATRWTAGCLLYTSDAADEE